MAETSLTLRRAAAALAGPPRPPHPGERRVRHTAVALLERLDVPRHEWDALRGRVAATLTASPAADHDCSVSFACAWVAVLTRNAALDLLLRASAPA